MSQLKNLSGLLSWVTIGDGEGNIQYLLKHPYLLYKIIAQIRRMNTGKNLLHVSGLECQGNVVKPIFLDEIVTRLEKTFKYVDPKILRWFGGDYEQLPFTDLHVSYYQSQDNLSHRQAQESAKQQNVFQEYSLIQALLLAEEAVRKGLLNWPRKYLIIYLKDRFEGKPCRVLGYTYDDGSIEIYVNQMDPGDVWTPGVGYIFNSPTNRLQK
jgi:hypothetical protein